MSSYPPQPPGGQPRPPAAASPFSNSLVRLGAVAVIGVAVILAFALGGGGSSNTSTTFSSNGSPPVAGAAAGPPFQLSLPATWSAVPASQLSAYAGDPIAVLLRANHTGVIVITAARSNPKLVLSSLGPLVAKRITSRFPDAKTVTAKIVAVRAGQAFYYSFVRTSARTVNAILVVPAGSVTYELNSVVPGDQTQAAKEIGQILLSFSIS